MCSKSLEIPSPRSHLRFDVIRPPSLRIHLCQRHPGQLHESGPAPGSRLGPCHGMQNGSISGFSKSLWGEGATSLSLTMRVKFEDVTLTVPVRFLDLTHAFWCPQAMNVADLTRKRCPGPRLCLPCAHELSKVGTAKLRAASFAALPAHFTTETSFFPDDVAVTDCGMF